MAGLVRLAEIWSQRALELSLQITVLVAAATLFCWLFRRADPRLRHAAWLVVLLRLLVPWPVEAPFGFLRTPMPFPAAGVAGETWPYLGVTAADVGFPERRDETPGSTSPMSAASASRLGPLLGWGAAAATLALLALARHRRTRRELEAADPPPSEIGGFVRRACRRLGISAPPVVLAPPHGAAAPVVFGVRPPLLVVPRRFAEGWSETDHGPLLVHELMHVKRGDPWVNLLVRIAETLYFFHPLVWWMGARIRRERELVCDDAVVRYYRRPDLYLKALGELWAGGARRSTVRLAGVSLFERRGDLVERVRRLAAPGYSAVRWRRSAIAIGLTLGLAAVTLSVARAPGERDWDRRERLSAGEIGALERRVEAAPGDLEARARLLEAYAYSNDPAAGAKHAEQAFWWIEHHPDMPADVAALAWSPIFDVETLESLRELWLHHLDTAPEDPAVLANASQFFLDVDPPFAEALLLRGRELAPADPVWSLELSRIYDSRGRSATAGTGEEWFGRSLEAGLRGLELMEDPQQRSYQLKPIAWVALRAGRVELAERLARELLRADVRWPTDWNAGNAIHHAHLILGHAALGRGDVEGAVEHLLAAGGTHGSPQLASFGPSMTLAAELLDAGEREAVLDYLERCSRFWKGSSGRLEAWAAAIRAGDRPDFSARRST